MDDTYRACWVQVLLVDTFHGYSWKRTVSFTDHVKETPVKHGNMSLFVKQQDPQRLLNISSAAIYKIPLFPKWQLSNFNLFHAFVVFSTTDHSTGNVTWWSIEKDTKGLFLQHRSKKADILSLKWNSEKRIDSQYWQPELVEETRVISASLKDVLEFLESNGELDSKYHILKANCQIFAKSVFNKLSVSKKWDPNIILKTFTHV